MIFPHKAVLFLEEDNALAPDAKPLMLQAVACRPILTWASEQLLADGVQRFFVVSSPRFADEVRQCFAPETEVIVSEQHKDLMDFLRTPDLVAVFPRAALPMASAGPGFAYAASGYALQESWKERMTNAVQDAQLLRGWLPVFGPETIAELEPLFKKGNASS